MDVIESPSSQAEADHREVMRLVAEGKRVTDPELRSRIRERSEAVGAGDAQKFGVVEIAVDLLREGRDGD